MKSIFSFILFLAIAITSVQAQEKAIEDALEYIKAASTLREAQQFERAEDFLLKALPVVEKQNRYWEASAYEGLGLVYRDQGMSDKAIKNLRKALKIYQRLKSATSIKAITALLESVEEKDQTYAGVEIGAKGVKMSVVDIRLTIEGHYKVTPREDKTTNPDIVTMTDESIEKAITAVNDYMAYIKKNYKLPKERIFVVASSGVKMAAEKHGKLDEVQQKLNKGIKDRDGNIKFITAEQEAYYVIKGATLPRYRAVSSTIDIGSGNTKGGFLFGERLENIKPVSFDFGTETFAEEINSQKLERLIGYDSLAKLLATELVGKSVDKGFEEVKGLETRKIVHLVGGAAWSMVTYLYPEKVDEPFVPVTMADIGRYKKGLLEEYELLVRPNLSFIANEEMRERAQGEIDRATANFNREKLIAGAIILEEIARRYNEPLFNKRFVYARQGYIGWITGYVMETVTQEYAKLDE